MLLAALLAHSPLLMPAAFAADEDEEGGYLEDDAKSGKSGRGKVESEGAIREIQRGFYGKAGVGAAAYLGKFASPVTSAGTYVSLGIGQDFVDTEKQSMAWELALAQGVHNGAAYEDQAALYGTYLEGDLRTYSLMANFEFSYYPVRRLGVGARAGAGVLYSPLLMEPEAYANDVVADAFGGYDPGLHGVPKPLVFGGPTMEYYTKLSHFSVGVDIDIVYGIGWDIGLNGAGTLKYSY